MHQSRRLGQTALRLPRVGFGGAGIMFGSRLPCGQSRGPETGGFSLPTDEEAHGSLQAAWDAGVRLFDTAPYYGLGQSEHRMGRFLYSEPRDSFVLTTKVGRTLVRPCDRACTLSEPGRPASKPVLERRWPHIMPGGGAEGSLAFDMRYSYTYGGVMRSFEDSLQRLGMQAGRGRRPATRRRTDRGVPGRGSTVSPFMTWT